jgi:hypothetical protein
MELLTLFAGFVDSLPAWLNAIIAVIVALKGITMLTPSTHDNAVLDKILKVLNFFALNILKDKNAE